MFFILDWTYFRLFGLCVVFNNSKEIQIQDKLDLLTFIIVGEGL